MKNYFTDVELMRIIDIIDDKIEYLEICDLPEDFCEKHQKQLSEIRQKLNDLL